MMITMFLVLYSTCNALQRPAGDWGFVRGVRISSISIKVV